MTMATVTNTIKLPDGTTPDTARVEIELVASETAGATEAGWITASDITVLSVARPTVTNGAWTADLTPNANIDPSGTVYRVFEYVGRDRYTHYISVGSGGGAVHDLLTEVPGSVSFANLAAHLADTADAHDASAISVADGGGVFTGTNVETVLTEINGRIDGLENVAINVADYGATADGSDNTTEYAAAVAALEALGGGRLIVPPGEWTGCVYLWDNMHLEGPGATLVHPDGNSARSVVQGITRTTTATSTATSATITVASAANVRPGARVGVYPGRLSPAQVHVLSGGINSSTTTVVLSSATGLATGTAGAFLIGSEIITFTGRSGTTLTGVARGAYGTTAASHSNGADVTFLHEAYADVVSVSGTTVVLSDAVDVTASGLTLSTGPMDCSVSRLKIDGAKLEGGSGNNPCGVQFDYSNRITVRDCEIYNGDHGGVLYWWGTSNSTVERCWIHDCGDVTGGLGSGVWVFGGDGCDITRNRIERCPNGIIFDDRSESASRWDAPVVGGAATHNDIDVSASSLASAHGVLIEGRTRKCVVHANRIVAAAESVGVGSGASQGATPGTGEDLIVTDNVVDGSLYAILIAQMDTLTIDGAHLKATQGGVSIGSTTNARVLNVTATIAAPLLGSAALVLQGGCSDIAITGLTSNGFARGVILNGSRVSVDGLAVSDCATAAVWIDGSSTAVVDVSLSNIEATDGVSSCDYMIYALEDVQGLRLDGFTFGPTDGYGIYAYHSSTQPSDIRISNGHIRGAGTGILISAVTGSISNVTVEGCASYGINPAKGASDITIAGCQVNSCTTNGIATTWGTEARVAVRGCSFSGNGSNSSDDVDLTLGSGHSVDCLRPSTTALRPAASAAGAGSSMYDTTLGKPIWSTGSAWVDATGTSA